TTRAHLSINLCPRDQVLVRSGHRIGVRQGLTGDCRVEREAKQPRLQLAWSNVGLNRQHSKFCDGKQNNRPENVRRYRSEHKRCDESRIHHSITLSVPVMVSWPSPQKTSQKNVKVPILSGTNRIVSTVPDVISACR